MTFILIFERVNFPCLQIWNEFVSLSEEEQEVIITRKTKTTALDKDTNWGNTNEDRNIPTEQGRVNPKYVLKGLARR